ncbi:WG repeat-containing protein [Shouchella lonarensis]|uniref:WG containing repeat-containing protein n=1 Tax=Shouchella lonarensis TaxID=1464122 RepID=A0A1G6P006_9BACI|nr:WG repeat-containing protein [Shouchella lonarensis]SDC73379.1 WG containing repeat-containing protein [Shouchella lonarensis]
MRRWREHLYPIAVKTVHGNKWGYIDGSGRVRISPIYDQADLFQTNGLAVVTVGEKQGVINHLGHYVVQPMYTWINPFSEGRAVAQQEDGTNVVIDESGKVRTTTPYHYIGPFKDGRAVFQPLEGAHYGYLDREGKEALPPLYINANDFENDRATVQKDEQTWALINTHGYALQTYHHPYVGVLSEGLMSFQKEADGKAGYLNEKGDIVIAPSYDVALPFSEDRAIVGLTKDYDTHYGLIDREGKVLIAPHYNEVRDLKEARYGLGEPIDPTQTFLGTHYALATKDGELLSDFVYTDIEPFHDGVASVVQADETFLIDLSGQKASPAFQGAGVMTKVNGLWQVFINNRIRYYDEGGQLVWEPETTIQLRQLYQVKEQLYRPDQNYIVYYPEIEGMTDAAQQRRLNEQLKTWSQVKTIPAEQLKEAAYTGDFEVQFFKKHLLVLELSGYNYPFGAAHGMPTKMYVNIDLRDGHVYQLADLFQPGTDYVSILNQHIAAQIAHDPAHADVFPDAFQTIAPDQSFYVDDEALYIVFDVYEIAPYVAGFPTFKIPFSELAGMINEQGSFWTSFHATRA